MKQPSQKFVYVRTYSHWMEEEMRREKYDETCERYINFMASEIGEDIITPYFQRLALNAIKAQDTMPSMRAMWSAGRAAKKNHIAMYNCAYVAIDDVKAFSEVLYILMCGTGVGFSVEKKYIDQLPTIAYTTGETVYITVTDSKEGWTEALDTALHALYAGHDISVDYSLIRSKGARLKTMGGRASGPEPLKRLMEFLRIMFKKHQEKGSQAGQHAALAHSFMTPKLSTLEAHDICCMIADIVVVGGVRRSSEISLSDLDDEKMATAKWGQFWLTHPHRAMSNNSATYNEGRPPVAQFIKEFQNLITSGTGERGIYNRLGALLHMVNNGRRKPWQDIGGNPCMEIILRSMQFCNLTEVVVRLGDTLDTLRQKVRIATMMGAWQSWFTKFPMLRPQWKQNCEEERLLGVSLTGIMDHAVLSDVSDKAKKWLSELKAVATGEARKWSKRLGINFSAAITCVKPSGTVSQLVDSSSGIHTRYAQFYIRRYRISSTDPLFLMMRAQGFKFTPENGQTEKEASTWVISFPVKAPTGAKTRHDITAIQQLEHWKMVKEFWCEHTPSCTVYVDETEWMDVMAWVYRNFDHITGLSFLPKDNGLYEQPPYEEIDEARYKLLLDDMPEIDYSQLPVFELDDMTEGSHSLACVGGVCDL